MKLREIERLRAMAILMVMGVHWPAFQKVLPDVTVHGWSGVDLFFVISGYVVTLSLVRLLPPLEAEATFVEALHHAKGALKTFYARRFFRIMPAALAVMLLDRFLMTVFPHNFGNPKLWFTEVIAFFGGVYNYAHAYHNDYRMGVYWSLAVEEHFYLMLPVLFVAFRTTSRRFVACAVVGLVSVVARALPHPDGVDVDFYEKFASHLRFDSLMAGVALALVMGSKKRAEPAPEETTPIMPRWLMRFAILPAALVVIDCLPASAPDYVMRREGFITLWLLSGLLVGFAALDRGYVLSFPVVGRVLEYLGSRSYAIYLTHVTVSRFEDEVGQQWPAYRALVPMDGPMPWRYTVVLFSLALVVAEILHRTVERPFMRLGRNLIDPERRKAFRLSSRVKRLLGAGAALVVLYYFRHPVLLALGPRDLALHKAVAMSSHENDRPSGDALVNGELEAEFGAHTRQQDSPWMTIDLGEPTRFGTIRVYNRADCCLDDAVPLEISVSNDNDKFTVVARRDIGFTQSFPWRIRFDGEPVRYVRLQAPRTITLCLSEVELFEGQGMAHVP